jgi:hypothetical protein
MLKIEFVDFIDFLEKTSPPESVISRLEKLKSLRERPDYHPEPNTFEHLRIVTERLMLTGDIDLVFAGCLHDLFKLDTLRINEKTGFPTCPNHDTEVAKFILESEEVKEWILRYGGNIKTISSLCKDHMRFHRFDKMKESKQDDFKSRPHWNKLEYLGAADNMIEEFDINNIQKSWKWSSRRERNTI